MNELWIDERNTLKYLLQQEKITSSRFIFSLGSKKLTEHKYLSLVYAFHIFAK